MLIRRRAAEQVRQALSRQSAVALIGARQVGKTTLALEIGEKLGAVYLDLESPADRAKLADPALYLQGVEERLVILDEVHRAPEIFGVLRGLIDQGRRHGRRNGRFLVLGSASVDMLRQSGETLAGRIEYVELNPFDVLEAAPDESSVARLWLRGGLPDSFLAASDADSLAYRQNFVRTYLERDIPQFGRRIPSETLGRFWTMLAHGQGTLLNASRLASGLSVSSPTVSGYVDLLADLLLVRRLPPFLANVGKRLVRSPKVYVRDSGLVHALLGIENANVLAGHPVVGPSWEGFVIENLLSVAPARTVGSFYRTAAGAEIDLLMQLPGHARPWTIEIKRGLAPGLGKSFYTAAADLKPERAFVVYSGTERYPLAEGVEAIGLRAMMELVQDG
ncbi:MAG TPA: ATP-binding protein [Bauldia sp.]|nr:ATP-binding protein [Bauldia sp.]